LTFSYALAISLLIATLTSGAVPTPLPRTVPLFSAATTKPIALPAIFDRRVLLQADVNGHLLWLHLDTGNPSLYLGPQDAKAAGLTVDPTTQYSQPVSVKIGGVTASAARFRIIPTYGFEAGGRRVSGLIGGAFFHANVITIDYPRERVIFYPPGTFTPPLSVEPTSIDFLDNKPVIHVAVGTTPGFFLLDTGSSITELSTHFASKVRLGFYRGTITTASGDERDEAVYDAPDVTVAGIRIQRPQVAIGDHSDAGEDGILGRDILSQFSITLDYANFAAYFVPEQ
jgi:predicted aspartyl protease